MTKSTAKNNRLRHKTVGFTSKTDQKRRSDLNWTVMTIWSGLSPKTDRLGVRLSWLQKKFFVRIEFI